MTSKLPLYWRVAAVPAVLAVVFAACGVALTQTLLDGYLERQAVAGVKQAAAAFALRVADTLARTADRVGLMARLQTAEAGAPAAALQQAMRWTVEHHKDYHWLAVVGPDGRIVAATRGELVGSPVHRDMLQQRQSGEISLSGLHAVAGMVPLRGEAPALGVDLSTPIVGGDGALAGWLVACIDWRTILSQREPILGLHVDSRRQGVSLHVYPSPSDRAKASALRSHTVAALPQEGPQPGRGLERVRSPAGDTLLAAYEPVPYRPGGQDLGWRVVATQPVAVALEPSLALQRSITLGGGLAAVLFGAAGYAFSRRLMRPYESLLGAMTRRVQQSRAISAGTLTRYLDVLTAHARELPLPRLASAGEPLQPLKPREALALLAHDATRLQRVLDALPVGVMMCDAEQRVVYWNAAARAVFGWADNEVLGRGAQETFVQGPAAAVIRSLLSDLQGSPTARAEGPARRHDGHELWCEWRAMQAWDDAGEFLGHLVVVDDLTERRQLQLRQQEKDALLAAIVDSASDAIVSVDAGGRVTLFNPAAQAIFQRSADEMLGQPLDVLLPADYRGRHHADLAAFGQEGCSRRPMGRSGHVRGVRADGHELRLDASISQGNVNDALFMTAILRDVTERVQAEEALKRYQLELKALTQRLMLQEKQTAQHIAQALHDQLGQTLLAIRLTWEAMRGLHHKLEHAQLQDLDERMAALMPLAMAEVRKVLVNLRPPLLEEEGLEAALDNEVRSLRLSSPNAAVELDVAPGAQGRRWPPDVEYAAFTIAREAIANALKHARARFICVLLEGRDDRLLLRVEDDGVGLPAGSSTVRPGHLGVVGMRERATAIGGEFSIGPGPDCGTVVQLRWSHNA
nr:PAS domain S-box protein [uncultured Caldimonas sp.]